MYKEQLSDKEAEVRIMKRERNEERNDESNKKVDFLLENKKLKVSNYSYETLPNFILN